MFWSNHGILKRAILGLGLFSLVVLCGFRSCLFKGVEVRLAMEAPVSTGVQIYYSAVAGDEFGEIRCLKTQAKGARPRIVEYVPCDNLHGLRLDFGSSPGKVVLSDCTVEGRKLSDWNAWTYSEDITSRKRIQGTLELFSDRPDPYMKRGLARPVAAGRHVDRGRFAALLAAALAVALWGCWLSLGAARKERIVSALNRTVFAGLSPLEILFCLLCLGYYLAWVFHPFNYAPDEAMRFEVTKFIFSHGRLPVNAETANKYFGFSYAHYPTVLGNVLGALFMKWASFFTSGEYRLLVAARLASVACGVGTVYWLVRTSKLLFSSSARWLMVCFVALLPQFAFVSSYVNNDVVALFGASMILFAWCSAIKGGWGLGNVVVLALGISVCATTYYNSYSWILCSLILFPAIYRGRNGQAGMWRPVLLVSLVVALIAGYPFARHVYVYGDLLGFSTVRKFALQLARPEFHPSTWQTPQNTGMGLWKMVFGTPWIEFSAMSFVGFFGYMRHCLPSWCYHVHGGVLCVSGFWLAWTVVERVFDAGRRDPLKKLLAAVFVAIMAITVALSVYFSYTGGFQPQGRYLFPALPVLAVLVAKGMEAGLVKFIVPSKWPVVVGGICLLLAAVTAQGYVVFRHSLG